MKFFENDENEKRASTERLEGDTITIPFPRPQLLQGDTRNVQ